MQFHVINFVRTAVINEKMLMPKLPKKLSKHKIMDFSKTVLNYEKKNQILLELV